MITTLVTWLDTRPVCPKLRLLRFLPVIVAAPWIAFMAIDGALLPQEPNLTLRDAVRDCASFALQGLRS